jgi:plasmid stability protein
MGMIQIRNVPDDLHRKLKARAAEEGMSLSDYLLRQISESAEKPTMAEWLARVRSRPPVELSEPAATIIRRMRDAAG